MRAGDLLTRAVSSLAVPESVMEQAGRCCAEAGLREPDWPQRLYREWVNDMVSQAGGAAFRQAAKDPAARFLGWLADRVSDPYRISPRAVASVRSDHGPETALLFATVRWRQEVAWARRMRGSDNDRIAVLAEMWLKAARRDPSGLFRGIAARFSAEAGFDPVYSGSAYHELSEDEILDGAGDDRHWRPVWMLFAEREFGPIVNRMPKPQMGAVACQIRQAAMQEALARTRGRNADRLRVNRPALMYPVLGAAVAEGLSSDDVTAAERDFVERIEKGALDLSAEPSPPWMVFMRGLRRWAGAAAPPSGEERSRRLDAIDALEPTWGDRMPEDFRRIGASRRVSLVAWFDSISGGERSPPEDPAVDFGMWLIEQGPQPLRPA